MTTTQRPRTALKPASVAAVSPGISLESQETHPGILLVELAHDLGASVLAAVVDEDHFVAGARSAPATSRISGQSSGRFSSSL